MALLTVALVEWRKRSDNAPASRGDASPDVSSTLPAVEMGMGEQRLAALTPEVKQLVTLMESGTMPRQAARLAHLLASATKSYRERNGATVYFFKALGDPAEDEGDYIFVEVLNDEILSCSHVVLPD